MTSFLHLFFVIISTSNQRTCARADEIPVTKESKKLEPVSSTSRRGARAAYHDEYPRDFGPRIAYTVSKMSDTSRLPTLCRPPIRQAGRQAGREREREMSAPRPSKTYPFHPPALFTSYTKINFCTCTKLVISSMWYIRCGLKHCTFVIYACSSRIHFKVQRHHFETILLSVLYVLVQDTLPLKLDTDESQFGVNAINARILRVDERKPGLKHTLIAPCYPRTNDQAERLVQNVGQLLRRKEAFQSSKVLVRCLFSYETNSTTYTNCSANKYFFQFFRKVLS